ncbi:TspO and MBR related proteins [Pedobacter westerhofensis]|uniref:TspO and MBR related proteins n=1 Tax=Pedobacter westerhofensis TaxID=425512 RepID=A0A521ESK5_9SPHI|nr:TspO/MBR family protein [Pedobacter westerhofensis]SMO86897.1 TspO and MBR related proteins [Pedobacter westerhofensis]
MPVQKKRFQALPFLVSLLITMIFGALGGLITIRSVKTWYPGIAKPSFDPPNWLFGPVWSTLFVIIAIAAYLVWTQRKHIAHFARTVAIFSLS